MEWNEIARQIVGLGAPLLGTALGGPLGSAAGKILAEALGAVATPGAVQNALASADAAKIAEAEARWIELVRAEAETQRTLAAETHATIRAEMVSDDPLQRWWRPFYAIELTLECAVLWAVLVHEFWTGDVVTINALIGATTLLVTYWAFRFGVLGVYVSGRTREKLGALTGEDHGGLIDRLVKSVVKKK